MLCTELILREYSPYNHSGKFSYDRSVGIVLITDLIKYITKVTWIKFGV